MKNRFIAGLAISASTTMLLACQSISTFSDSNKVEVQQSEQEPIWDANKIELESQKLTNGVYAVVPTHASELGPKGIPIATTSGFVVGDKGVLVVDSMLNERLFNQLMELIAKETDKPVTHMVNTSYHGDHSYGNFYLPSSVNIIQHEKSAQYISDHFAADTDFMIQNFGQGRGIEAIEPVPANTLVKTGETLLIDLGGTSVKIKDYGFAQTGGDLFVSVPDANVLWTGNPVIAEAPALPWLLDGHLVETLETLREVYSAFNDNTQIVPGHGPVTDRSAIQHSIDYLDAVRQNVQNAINAGLTLDETVAQADFPEYQGYALYGWVHPQLNVPAAYKDLAGSK